MFWGMYNTFTKLLINAYVYSLGDRHGENILFDETNGETLHVDFNCLFDKVCLYG